MKLKRNCKVCETPFTAIKGTQVFCSRRCFKRDYYVRNKLKLQIENSVPNFPRKKCSFCGNIEMLNFDPIQHPDRFDEWACTECGVTNNMLWEHQNHPNSFQVISGLLQSMTVKSFFLNRPEVIVETSIITIVGDTPKSKNQYKAF